MIVRAEVFVFVKTIEYLTNSVIKLKTFFFILTYHAIGYLIKNIFKINSEEIYAHKIDNIN